MPPISFQSLAKEDQEMIVAIRRIREYNYACTLGMLAEVLGRRKATVQNQCDALQRAGLIGWRTMIPGSLHVREENLYVEKSNDGAVVRRKTHTLAEGKKRKRGAILPGNRYSREGQGEGVE